MTALALMPDPAEALLIIGQFWTDLLPECTADDLLVMAGRYAHEGVGDQLSLLLASLHSATVEQARLGRTEGADELSQRRVEKARCAADERVRDVLHRLLAGEKP